jgi:hypothetical protein
MRLRADFWVSAFLRRCDVEGLVAVLRRRGAAEAGGVYIKLDCLDGRCAVFGPAPQTDLSGDSDRVFVRLHKDEWTDPLAAEERLKRAVGYDSDIWIVELENRAGHVPIVILSI